MDRIENDASKNSSVFHVFVAAKMYWPSRCLATIWGYIKKQEIKKRRETEGQRNRVKKKNGETKSEREEQEKNG
jgi:hypothetical protein